MSEDVEVLTFCNLNPTPDDLLELAYSKKYKYVCEDWALCVANFEHRDLYLELALDQECECPDLFMQLLFHTVGGLVHGAPYNYNRYTKKHAPLPTEIVDRLLTIQTELQSIQDSVIQRLCVELDTLVKCGKENFNYQFWFEDGWVR